MAEELIFCSRCGAQNDATARFCQRCGASLLPAGTPAATVPAPPATYAAPVARSAYGGFWIRFLAFLIDGILLGAVLVPLSASIWGIHAARILHGPWDGERIGNVVVLAPAWNSLWLIGSWLYEAFMLSSTWQATLGKLALGLRVTDEYGQRITFLRATGRHFAKYLSWMTACIGFIMVAFTERRQALHDFVAGTLVWRDRRY
jgi:uncharacterized RDD family membrane protein YckC